MERYPSAGVPDGTPRRRQWSAEEKARIVAESSARGVVARSVAFRHGIHPNQLYAWRREFRRVPGAGQPAPTCGFVPVTVAEEAPGRSPDQMAGAVEIELGGAVLRAVPGVEMGFLSAVLRAVRASL